MESEPEDKGGFTVFTFLLTPFQIVLLSPLPLGKMGQGQMSVTFQSMILKEPPTRAVIDNLLKGIRRLLQNAIAIAFLVARIMDSQNTMGTAFRSRTHLASFLSCFFSSRIQGIATYVTQRFYVSFRKLEAILPCV